MRTALLLTMLLLAAGFASAGSPADPEITDPDNDRELASAGFAGLELVKGWVQNTETDLLFFLEANAAPSPGSSTQYEWWFDADVGGTVISLGLVGLNGGGYEAAGDATDYEVLGNVITWMVPRADVGAVDGTIITGLSAHADGYGAHGGPPRLATDRAPDSGAGRDYVVTAPASDAPDISVTNVTEPELSLDVSFANATTMTAIYNWTGAANVTMDLQVVGNGTVNVTINDPTGGGQFDCLCTDGTNETLDFMSEEGNWTITLDYQDFAGDLRLHMAPTTIASADDGESMAGSGPADEGNSTDEPDQEDSPVPVLLAVAALFIAARRKR